MGKAKVWLIQAPRWFAAPFFGASTLIGSVLAGGISSNAWIGLVGGLLIMAGGHVLNTWGDWITGLDRGEPSERSAGKAYTGGSGLIAEGKLGVRETLILGIVYYALALGPVIYLAQHVSLLIIPVAAAGMLVTLWYSLIAKFNWTHELALAVAVGPLAVFLGMFSVNPNPPLIHGLLVSVLFAIVLSFFGLAVDEWPDAEANLKKGVKSIAYMVWKYSDWVAKEKRDYALGEVWVKSLNTLLWYCTSWIMFLLIYQLFLVEAGILKLLSGLAFIPAAIIIPLLVLLKGNFKRIMLIAVGVGALYSILLVVGQVIG